MRRAGSGTGGKRAKSRWVSFLSCLPLGKPSWRASGWGERGECIAYRRVLSYMAFIKPFIVLFALPLGLDTVTKKWFA